MSNLPVIVDVDAGDGKSIYAPLGQGLLLIFDR
jgi:hypothetical protein